MNQPDDINELEDQLSELPPEWYCYFVVSGVDVGRPGLYRWDIEGVGSYIGKYKSIKRPTKAYTRNVNNLRRGKRYRLSNPDGYRRIHRELEKAHSEGRKITLTILENVEPDEINQRELELIALHGDLNDPPFGRRPD